MNPNRGFRQCGKVLVRETNLKIEIISYNFGHFSLPEIWEKMSIFSLRGGGRNKGFWPKYRWGFLQKTRAQEKLYPKKRVEREYRFGILEVVTPTEIVKKEYLWMHRLNTFQPVGINIEYPFGIPFLGQN